jgi:hypothetical protein
LSHAPIRRAALFLCPRFGLERGEMKIHLATLAAVLALAACSSQPTAGGLSADDERALDNAAAMLDQPNVFDAAPDSLAANEAETAPQESGAGTPAANRSGNAQ